MRTNLSVLLFITAIAGTLLLANSHAQAQEVYPWEVRTFGNILRIAADMSIDPWSEKQCKGISSRPTCAELTDDFCDALWSEKNKGTLVTGEGVIQAGKSNKGGTSAAELADMKALLDAEKRLPKNLGTALGPTIKELRAVLAKEKDSDAWRESLKAVQAKIEKAIKQVATAEVDRTHPELKPIKAAKLSRDQNTIYFKQTAAMKDLVTAAKYAQQPNWQRAERAFRETQTDLHDEIESLSISADEKRVLLDKLEKIKIVLPSFDPNNGPFSKTCPTTDVNAYYDRARNVFTLCAGFFNTYQAESALYGIIAHEISHAIDPITFAKDEWNKTSPLIASLRPLDGMKGPVFSCADWEKIAAEAKKPRGPVSPRSRHPLQSTIDCIRPKDKLEPLTDRSMKEAAARLTLSKMNAAATPGHLSTLARSKTRVDGKVVDNDMYLRPDLLLGIKYYDGISIERSGSEPGAMEIFTQSFSCAPGQDGKEKFDFATAETSKVIEALTLDWLMYCGQDCPDLRDQGLSVSSWEHFADWMTNRALNRRLSRIDDLRKRREAAALNFSLYCDESDSGDPEGSALNAAEKAYSFESHPARRERKRAGFNSPNAELVQCETTPADQGFGRCE